METSFEAETATTADRETTADRDATDGVERTLSELVAAVDRVRAAGSLEDTLERCAAEARWLLDAPSASISVSGDRGTGPERTVVSGDDEIAGAPIEPEGTVPDGAGSRPATGSAGRVAAPLIDRRGETIGVLRVADADPRRFTPAEGGTAALFARMAGGAIETSRLREELARRRGNAAALEAEVERTVIAHESAIDVARIVFWEWDSRTDEMSWSADPAPILGHEPGRAPHDVATFVARVHPDDRDAFVAEFWGALDRVDRFDELYRVVRDDGTIVWVRDAGRFMRAGDTTRGAGAIVDVTASHELTLELSARVAQQGAIAALSQLAIGDVSVDAVMDRAATVLRDTLEIPIVGIFEVDDAQDELVLRAGAGWRPGQVGTARIPGGPGSAADEFLSRGEAVVFADLAEADDRLVPALLREHGVRSGLAAPIAGPDRPYGVLLACGLEPHTFTDDDSTFLHSVANVVAGVLARRLTEEQLVQAQKMEAIGRLSGGIAHDFNNLLTVMLGFGEMLEPAVADQEEAASDLRELLSAANRAAGLVDQLLTFSRGRPEGDGTSIAEEVLGSLDPLLHRILQEDIELEFDLPDRRSVVPLDAVRLEQVVMNLVVNAGDAMPDGGSLHIGVEPVSVSVEAGRRLEVDPGPYVRITVADSGRGMDPEVSARAFEPFFTTKSGRQGSGLGLSTVYGIVRGAGGDVSVASRAGLGTVVTVHLPTIDSEVGDPGRSPRDPGTIIAAEDPLRILLVEDQAAVRRLVREVLVRYDHEVVEASNGIEALDIAGGGNGIDLLVTDIVMPQMNGIELARRLRGSASDLAVLYMSGHTDEVLRSLEDGAVFLPKPFHAEDLVAAVARAVSTRTRSG